MTRPTLTTRWLCGAAACGSIVLAAGAAGQERRVMVFEDDGGGPQVIHYSGPEMREIRTPDYVRKDLPIFDDTLRLDEMQRLVLRALLDVYLDAFTKLADETLPQPGGNRFMMGPEVGGGEGGPMAVGGDVTLDRIMRDALSEAGGLDTIDIEAEGPGHVAIAIKARVGEEGEDGDFGGISEDFEIVAEPSGDDEMAREHGPNPSGASVFIAVEGSGDVELPEEVRKQLEEKARELAEKIQAQLEAAEAQGVDFRLPENGMDAQEAFEAHQEQFDDLRKAVEEFERQKAGLAAQFASEVQSQLSVEQLGAWPDLERTLTRHKTLPKGRLDGERTDLTLIAGELAVVGNEDEAVAERLHEYEVALHQALLQRNAYLREANRRLDEALQDGKRQQALSIADKSARLRVAVRDVNEAYAETIAQRLEEKDAAEFRRAVLKASYPRVYSRTRAKKALAEIRKLDGLSEETQAAIETLADAYDADLALVNERIRQTIHTHQPKESRRMVERLQAMMADGGAYVLDPDDDPIRAAFEKRKQLDERYMKQFYDLLTPEQADGLPPLPSQEPKRNTFFIEGKP